MSGTDKAYWADKDRMDRLLTALQQGASRRAAANAAGMDAYSLYDWLRKGRRDRELGREDSPYPQILAAVEAAEADGEVVAISTIRSIGRGGIIEVPVLDKLRRPMRDDQGNMLTEMVYHNPKWEALAWLLERRFPQEWSKQSTVNVNTTQLSPERVELEDDSKVISLYDAALSLLEQAKSEQTTRRPPSHQLEDHSTNS